MVAVFNRHKKYSHRQEGQSFLQSYVTEENSGTPGFHYWTTDFTESFAATLNVCACAYTRPWVLSTYDPCVLTTWTIQFYGSRLGMVVHAQTVDTRLLSPLLRGLGTRLCHIPTDYIDDMTSTSLTCKLNQTYKHTFLSRIFSSFGSCRQEKNHHVMKSRNLTRNTQPVVHASN